jgi:hypothetical protein
MLLQQVYSLVIEQIIKERRGIRKEKEREGKFSYTGRLEYTTPSLLLYYSTAAYIYLLYLCSTTLIIRDITSTKKRYFY